MNVLSVPKVKILTLLLSPLLSALITATVPLARADCRRGFFFSTAAAELLPVVADAELVRLQLPVAHLPQEAQDRQHRQASRRDDQPHSLFSSLNSLTGNYNYGLGLDQIH